ncbi:MAG: hypothetical protein M1813_002233 [Trichoglossum hirsutum]|nr:MAG: hypothetical protein M1813_002233 [Trichoglossum hirsutum]
MRFTATALALLTAATAAVATHVHNQYGHSGWIEDQAGTDIALPNGGSATVAGGWGFFWVDASVCADNSVTYTWPESYGDVYIHHDGYLYDSNGNRITNAHLC